MGTVADAVLSAPRAAVAVRSLAAIADRATLPQFWALVVLCDRRATGVSALRAELEAPRSTGTRVCDRLVSKGLANRQRVGMVAGLRAMAEATDDMPGQARISG